MVVFKIWRRCLVNVVITGGSNGLGYALGKSFAEMGENVVSLDLAVPDRKIKGVLYKKCDVTRGSDLSKCLKDLKRIDVLVCNAGVMRRGNLLDYSEKDYDFVMGVNLKGSWLTLKNAYGKLSDNATVLFISSRHGAYLNPDPAIYSLSKSAVIDLAEILKKTNAKLKVKIAALGSFDSSLSRHGVSKKDLAIKLKGIRSASSTAEMLVKFINNKYGYLLYNQKNDKYFYV